MSKQACKLSDNFILRTDSYKSSQWKQYPPNATNLFSYFESRGGVYPAMVFFGLQYYLNQFFSKRVTVKEVKQAKEFLDKHGVKFNYDGWMYIAKKLKGKIPVRIRAVPEGTIVPTHTILMSIESTDPKCFWVVNWLETLLVKVWYPITVATQSHYLRAMIYESLVKTADDPDGEIDFKLHSFGYRGVSSEESAGIGAMAELISFKGTDTIRGIIFGMENYDSDMIGFSINASEHSTITSWENANEVEACRNMIKQFGDEPIFACVSDSYDIYNCITNIWGGVLKDEVMNMKATLVIRPDSGIPTEVVPKCLQLMEAAFGYTINSKGYKVINKVRLIQGDGVNPTSIKQILDIVNAMGFSTTNIAFGMGGASLQGSVYNVINRDTQKFAFKASSITVDGKERDVYKDPVTDHGKRSKRGRLDLVNYNGKFETVRLNDGEIGKLNTSMQTVFENGEFFNKQVFSSVKFFASKG